MQAAIGKVSFSAEAIKENAEAFIGLSIKQNLQLQKEDILLMQQLA